MQDAGDALHWARRSEIHFTQDGGSEITIMQEMQCEKEATIHIFCECPSLERVRKRTNWRGLDRIGPNKRSEAEQHRGLG